MSRQRIKRLLQTAMNSIEQRESQKKKNTDVFLDAYEPSTEPGRHTELGHTKHELR